MSHYIQQYKGYPIEGKLMNVTSKCDIVLSVCGTVIPNLNIDVSTIIPDSIALDSALKHVKAIGTYPWMKDGYREAVYESVVCDTCDSLADPNFDARPKGTLVIVKKFGDSYEDIPSNYQLCWKFTIPYNDTIHIDTLAVDSATVFYNTFDTVMRSQDFYVTASNGSLFTQHDPTMGSHYSNIGNFWSWYNGIRHNELEYFVKKGTYYLKDNTRNLWTESFKYGGISSTDVKGVISDGNPSFANDDRKTGASAHWATEVAYNYFWTRFNRRGADGSNHPVRVFTQQYLAAPHWEYSSHNFMGQGDEDDIMIPLGNWTNFVGSLDVMGHEYTHAYIYRSSAISNTGKYESEALEEGFSDIFGLLSERWWNGWTDWEWGNDPFHGAHKRSFHDPNLDDIGSFSTVNDVNWSVGDKYQKSGPLRRWFNQGEWDWNPAYSGVGLDIAEKISYYTLLFKLYPGVDYKTTAKMTLATAADFYGMCGDVYHKVAHAWSDVGVNINLGCKAYGFKTPRVILVSQLSAVNKPILQVISTAGSADPQNTVNSYTWLLPPGWVGNFSSDNSQFTLTSVPDYSSHMVRVIVSYTDPLGGSYKDTLAEGIHFCTTCSDETVGSKHGGTIIETPNNINNEDMVFVYPNPASNMVNVLMAPAIGKAVVKMYDITGREVLTSNLSGGNNYISIPKVSAGIYMLKIKGEKVDIVKRMQVQ